MYLPSCFLQKYHPALSIRFDGYLQPSHEYPQPPRWYQSRVPSERMLLSLGVLNRIDCTHVKDVKDPDKILLPSRNLLLIALREDESGYYIPLALLDDLLLDPGQSSAIEMPVSGSLAVRIASVAHAVRSPIASRIDWLSLSDRFPFNLRSSTWHTSPQARPRSTKS